MAKILRPVLKLLESLYRFSGGQDGAPTEFELGLGIQAVHDVSHEVEAADANNAQGRPAGGYWIATVIQNHTVVGVLTDDINFVEPTNASNGYVFNEGLQWVWLIDAWGIADDAGDFEAATLFMRPNTNDFFVGPHDSNPADSVDQLLVSWTSVLNRAGIPLALQLGAVQAQLPVLILSPQDGIQFASRSDAAGTVQIEMNARIWVGKRGTFPPGMY